MTWTHDLPPEPSFPSAHACPYPVGGCTSPDCHVTAGRFDERFIEALMRVAYDHRPQRWLESGEHRRLVAVAQLAELRRVGLVPNRHDESEAR